MPKLTLAGFQDTDLPLEEMVVGRMDHVHDYFLTFRYEVVDDLPPGKGDLVVLIDGEERRSKLERIAAHEGRVILVAAPMDGPFWTYFLPGMREAPANLSAAFLANNDIPDSRVMNIPVGILAKKASRLRAARRRAGGRRSGLLYGNFNLNPAVYQHDPNGGPHVRQRLAEQFAHSQWATMDVAIGARTSDDALEAYYANLVRHRFVLSPEGLGADCYRHWECLYLGAIPIVRRSTAMSAFSDLPILFTDDYSELNEAYLEEQWERFAGGRFEFKRLMKSYYRERFLQSVTELSDPRFLCWGFRGTSEESFLDQLESVV